MSRGSAAPGVWAPATAEEAGPSGVYPEGEPGGPSERSRPSAGGGCTPPRHWTPDELF